MIMNLNELIHNVLISFDLILQIEMCVCWQQAIRSTIDI